MRTRLILIAATWAAVVGLVAGSAHAQAPTQPGGRFVLVGVVMLEGGRELAWIQEPSFTNDKVVTVRLGDSVGPYRVTKILTHQVELTGPGGTVSVPLAGLPGAVGVASRSGTSSPGAVQPSAGQMPPGPALSNATAMDTSSQEYLSRKFPASRVLIGAGAIVSAPAQDFSVPAAMQTSGNIRPPAPGLNDPAAGSNASAAYLSKKFPMSKMFVGKMAAGQ